MLLAVDPRRQLVFPDSVDSLVVLFVRICLYSGLVCVTYLVAL